MPFRPLTATLSTGMRCPKWVLHSHLSLFEDRAGEGDIGDLEALLGPDGAGLFPPSGLESDASLDGGEAGSVHYY